MADIAVESFDVDVANASTHTLTDDVGATTKAFIRRPGPSDKASGGPTGSTANQGPNNTHIGMALTATDTVTFYAGSSTTRKVIGEVWRYTGSGGGANEFIKRGSYAVSLSGSSASQAVSGISDRNACVPFITGISTSESDRANFEYATVYAYIDGSDNLVVGRNNSGTTCTVYVDVVEFTGSNWSVGHGVSNSHDVSDETVTLNTDSTGSGGTTFDVSDWETAFIEANMGGDTNETGLSDVLIGVVPGSGTTTAEFQLHDLGDGAARNDAAGYIHVIQNDDLIVKRNVTRDIAEGNGSYGTATWPTGASTARDIDELALEWFVDTTGTGTAHARGRLNARITDATGTIQHWVHRSGNTVDVAYGVIDLSQLSDAGGVTGTGALTLPTHEATGSGTETISGTGSISLIVSEVDGDGSQVQNPTGSGALTLGVPTVTGSGTESIEGSGSLLLLPPTISGTGSELIEGTGDVSVPVPSVEGEGSHTVNPSGSGALTSQTPTITSTGVVAFEAAGDLITPSVDITGSGTLTIPGTGAPTLYVPTLDGQGLVTISGSGALSLLSPAVSGSGTHVTSTVSGSGALSLPVVSVTGIGLMPPSGVGALTLPLPTIAGDGIVPTEEGGAAKFGALSRYMRMPGDDEEEDVVVTIIGTSEPF